MTSRKVAWTFVKCQTTQTTKGYPKTLTWFARIPLPNPCIGGEQLPHGDANVPGYYNI